METPWSLIQETTLAHTYFVLAAPEHKRLLHYSVKNIYMPQSCPTETSELCASGSGLLPWLTSKYRPSHHMPHLQGGFLFMPVHMSSMCKHRISSCSREYCLQLIIVFRLRVLNSFPLYTELYTLYNTVRRIIMPLDSFHLPVISHLF